MQPSKTACLFSKYTHSPEVLRSVKSFGSRCILLVRSWHNQKKKKEVDVNVDTKAENKMKII